MKKALSLIFALSLLLSVMPASAITAPVASAEPMIAETTEPVPSELPENTDASGTPTNGASVNASSSPTEYASTSGEGSLNYTSTEVYEGKQITLEVTGISGTVSWRTSNSTLATVNNGVVTGKKAGVVKITATVPNYTPLQCTVYVVKAGGTYNISTGGKYLGIEGIQENTPAKMVTQYSEGPRQLRQLWKIKHLGYGYYSIRPLYKLDMALHATNGTVDITSVDSPATVPMENKWRLYCGTSGYEFRYEGSLDECMRPSTGSSSGVITDTFSEDVAGYQWTMTKVTGIEDQMLLINTTNGLPSTNAVRYITPGETRTLNDLNLAASFVSMTTNTQSITWISSNTSVVVNSSTGTITGNATTGSTKITAQRTYEGTTYKQSFTVNVLPIPEGTYFIGNAEYRRYLQIDNNDQSSGYTSSEAIMEQWSFSGAAHQKWRITVLDDGYYVICSAKSGQVLSVPSGETGSTDVSLVQEPYQGLDRQKWRISQTSDYWYKIKPKSSENLDNDLVMAVGYSLINDSDGVNIEQRKYIHDSNYKDEWLICANINVGMSTDNYPSGCCSERQSYRYANKFYDELDGPITPIHHYNKDSTHEASKKDFSVNGAISDNADFMVFIGHGLSANNTNGNCLHYSYSANGTPNTTKDCRNEIYNVYTSKVKFGSSTSDLRWVWLYTCIFLHAKEDNNDNDSNTSNDNDYVTDAMLKKMMNGAHMVMGYASRATLCDTMSLDFATYLCDGLPLYDAYFKAGHTGEASVEKLNHFQKIIYIPQARYETIYSPRVYYTYDNSDVKIVKRNIQDEYNI